MSYAIIPWNTQAGYAVPFVVLGVILLVSHVLMVVLWLKGVNIREWSAGRFKEARETHHGDVF